MGCWAGWGAAGLPCGDMPWSDLRCLAWTGLAWTLGPCWLLNFDILMVSERCCNIHYKNAAFPARPAASECL